MQIEHIPPYAGAKPFLYRLFELIPGTLVWATFALAIILSFANPGFAMIVIILFDLYWLIRVLYFIYNIVIAWFRYRQSLLIDWCSELRATPEWETIWHVIILPTFNEPDEVLEASFKSLAQARYPKEKMIVVLSGEGRARADFEKRGQKIKKQFDSVFSKLLITVHPDKLPGEIRAKGANAHWAGKKVREYVDAQGIAYEKIIVSYFDVDTCAHPDYFSALAIAFLKHPKRLRTCFQPVALYNNNIWESSPIMRVAAFGTTFWLLTELVRPQRLFTFSSHSIPFQALVDVDFWQKDIVTDDSRIFLQCFLRYDGDFTVTPLYLPVSMDTAQAQGRWQSLVNLYKQQRRWAWGVEHLPYMLWHFRKNKKIPPWKKFTYLWNLGEGMYSWATAPILIFMLGYLPRVVAARLYPESILLYNTPHILQVLMNLAMIGILISAILNLRLIPKCPHVHPLRRIPEYILMVAQWILLPVTLIIFGSIPAVEAQTRLLFGKYLGFWVTRKTRRDATARTPV